MCSHGFSAFSGPTCSQINLDCVSFLRRKRSECTKPHINIVQHLGQPPNIRWWSKKHCSKRHHFAVFQATTVPVFLGYHTATQGTPRSSTVGPAFGGKKTKLDLFCGTIFVLFIYLCFLAAKPIMWYAIYIYILIYLFTYHIHIILHYMYLELELRFFFRNKPVHSSPGGCSYGLAPKTSD